MPNHVHLVMVPETEDGLRPAWAEAHRQYTRYVNFRQWWRGHLLQERFHSFAMDEHYLRAAVRYVERNPMAAKLCTQLEYWPWSSVKAHLSGEDDGVVQEMPMLSRVSDWRRYPADDVNQGIESPAIQMRSRTGLPLGEPEFISALERLTGKTLARRQPGPKPKPQQRQVYCPRDSSPGD